jgi:hypothetical protein
VWRYKGKVASLLGEEVSAVPANPVLCLEWNRMPFGRTICAYMLTRHHTMAMLEGGKGRAEYVAVVWTRVWGVSCFHGCIVWFWKRVLREVKLKG